MDLSGVDEVEDLEHDKGVEDKGIMPRVVFGSLECSLIIRVAIDPVESSTADCASNNSLIPLERRVSHINWVLIKRILVLWDEKFSEEDDDGHDDHLEDRLSDNVFLHQFGDDVSISCVRLAEQ